MLTLFKRKRNQSNNYGLMPNDDLKTMSYDVCSTLQGSGEYAAISADFLYEIAMAETNGGRTWDKTQFAGMGITQIDKIGFVDTIKRTPTKRKAEVLEKFGFDLDLCEWGELRHNPRLCLLITRLFLMLRPGAIPKTIEERSGYWKRWYNSKAGKGTPKRYLIANGINDESRIVLAEETYFTKYEEKDTHQWKQ